MYTFLLLMLIVPWIFVNYKTLKRVDRHALVFSFVIAIALFCIYSFQIVTMPYSKSSAYFSLASNDSYRYLKEARMFSCFWCINELTGTYNDGIVRYSATPKFGLSAYLAIFFPLTKPSLELAYGAMMFLSVILNISKIILIRSLCRNVFQYYFAIGLIVFFPLDLYWNMRFLREPIANDLLELCVLLMIYIRATHSLDRSKIYIFVVFVLWLILWRAQLAILVSGLAVTLFLDNRKVMFSSLAIFFLATVQGFAAAGQLIVKSVGFLPVVPSILSFIFENSDGIEMIYPILFFFPFVFLLKLGRESWRPSKNSRVPYAAVVFLLGFIIVSASGQIRFLYPLVMVSKIFVVAFVCSWQNPNSKVWLRLTKSPV